jgi:hypothetical protein
LGNQNAANGTARGGQIEAPCSHGSRKDLGV